MNRRLAAIALAAALLFVAAPARADFNSLTRAMQTQLGAKPVWIPFFGVARMFIRMLEPSGVHDIQLAVWENKGRLGPVDAQALLKAHAGQGFSPLVRTTSKRGNGEQAFIYARPQKDNRIELLILALEPDEAVAVRVVVDPEKVTADLDHGEFINVARK